MPRGPRGQKSYRAALDRLFETGKISDLVQQQAAEQGNPVADAESESRIKLRRQIMDAEGRANVSAAVDAYLGSYELPADAELLGKVIEHRNPSLQREAMELLLGLVEQEKPRRSRAVIGQLKLIRDTADEEELVDLARRLIDRLE